MLIRTHSLRCYVVTAEWNEFSRVRHSSWAGRRPASVQYCCGFLVVARATRRPPSTQNTPPQITCRFFVLMQAYPAQSRPPVTETPSRQPVPAMPDRAARAWAKIHERSGLDGRCLQMDELGITTPAQLTAIKRDRLARGRRTDQPRSSRFDAHCSVAVSWLIR